MIQKVDNTETGGKSFVISSGGTWLPGSYDSERAAKYALRFKHDQLVFLTETICFKTKRDITFEDLQAEYQRNKA